MLPDCYLTPDENEPPGSDETYQRQMHVIVLDESEKDKAKE